MYINPKQKRNTLLINAIVLFSMLGMAAGVYYGIHFFTHASKSTQPENVIVSNILSTSVNISWETDTAVIGSVKLEDGRVFTDDRGLISSKYHYVTINDLDPNHSYNYSLISGDKESSVDILGTPLQFKTFSQEEDPMITNLSGQVKSDCLIIAYIHNNFFSALSTSQGDFNLKLIDYNNIPFSPSDDMQIFVISPGGKMTYEHAVYGALFDVEQKFIGRQKLIDTEGAELALLSKKTGSVANYSKSDEIQSGSIGKSGSNTEQSFSDMQDFNVNSNSEDSNKEPSSPDEATSKLFLQAKNQVNNNSQYNSKNDGNAFKKNDNSGSMPTKKHLKLKQQ